MHIKKIKWLIYTVLVGLIPIMCRSIIWMVTPVGTIDFFVASDFIAFGLVLHISNINEIEHLETADHAWKTAQNGFSIVFISFYSVLFFASLINEKLVDKKALILCSLTLSFISFLISYSVYYRISRNEEVA